MTASRLARWTLLLAAGFALRPAPAAAQDGPLPARPPTDLVVAARDGRGIPKEELDATRKQMAALAKYYADWVAHPLVHRAAADPTKIPAGVYQTMDQLIEGLNRFLLEPNPANTSGGAPKVTADKLDYIRELGAALDAALKPLVETHPERVVRVNAARVHAAACKTGAAAHWPTVTGWLANPNTPTEIKQYALQAAANLLAAYNVNSYSTRRHAIPDLNWAAADKVIGGLVAAVEQCVLNPAALGPGAAGNPGVVEFVRRQAIKALAQVRFVSLPGEDGKTPLYPAHTLARVCLADPALAPAPGPADCAEAVIGLCNMAPMVQAKAGTAYVGLKGYRQDAAAEAVATGLVAFATPRTDPTNKSLPWKGYSARLGDALRGWRPLFDEAFDATRPAAYKPEPTEKGPIPELVKRAQDLILAPIDNANLAARVDIEGVRALLRPLQANPKRPAELIDGVPATKLPPPKK
jgi:hypothetical protein